METPRILFSSDIFTATSALVSALGFLQYLRFCNSFFPPEVDDEIVEDHQSGRASSLRKWMKQMIRKMRMSYQRPVTSRCYVTSFRKHCDAFVEIIDDEVEQTLKNLNIHQFLKFPAFQQCIPLLFEVLKFWSPADEGFIVLVEMMVPKVEAQKRCQVILDPNSCNLPVCREECFKRKKNGFGECISNTAGTAYACYCFYDC
ncbi:Putative defensin-like protein 165 [Dendrobium catenatum]|uniref:Defensin-like protein 165 n=1 Tax=Dendrobium catenatum TaxID=906689 RepID=A0A2I0VT35_9ASPA|nr:Putative defensin-like protein 165 [Dendrobium catenatum]